MDRSPSPSARREPDDERLLLISVVTGVTVATALALVAAGLARRARAASRHALLAASLVVAFALPLVAIVAPTIRVALPAQSEARDQVGPASFDVPDVQLRLQGDVSATIVDPQPAPWRPSATMTGLSAWLVGVLLCLGPMWTGLRQMRSLRRAGRPCPPAQAAVESLASGGLGQRRVDVLTHQSVAGPVTCGVRRAVIVLPTDAARWSVDGLTRALIHELEHIRRWDWITQCLARVLCACYWFHPLVWTVRRQLVLEAERACDDAVLCHPATAATADDATAYADQLVDLARRLSGTNCQPLLAMADRRDLATRVRALLDSGQARGRAGARLLTAVTAASLAIVAAVSPLRMVAASDNWQVTSDTPRFEAATIKPCGSAPAPSVGRGGGAGPTASPGRLHIDCTPLIGDNGLIRMAYAKFANGQVNKDRAFLPITGAPAWAASEAFTIDAKATGDPGRATMLGPMLQALLNDAFHLKTHRESRPVPVYNLGVARGGPKLRAFDNSCTPIDFAKDIPTQLEATGSCVFVAQGDTWDAPGQTIDDFIKTAMSRLDRPVVNTTGLSGRFTIHLDLASDAGADPSQTMARALQQQLGLTLTPATGAQDILVVDAVQRPDPTFVRGASQSPADQPHPLEYDAAVVRRCDAPASPGKLRKIDASNGHVYLECGALATFVSIAYAKDGNYTLNSADIDRSVRGGENWTRDDLYTIDAKASGVDDQRTLLGSRLRALLEERFHVRTHVATEDVPMYALTVAKGETQDQADRRRRLPAGGCRAAGWRRAGQDALRDDPGPEARHRSRLGSRRRDVRPARRDA